MSAEEEMNADERRKYLRKMLPLYLRADRAGKGELLGQMEAVTGMARKSLIRLMRSQQLGRRKRAMPRGRSYGLDVEKIVGKVWESLDYVCVERLKPGLLPTARHLARFGELALNPELEVQLAKISESTLQRMIGRLRYPKVSLPRKGPEEANRLSKGVPMGKIRWDTAEPGHLEVDLVHHSGESTAGEYVHTLQMVDVATGWSERVAVLGRSAHAMETAFRKIMGRLPFPILQLHPDNGGEFFSHHLMRYFGEELVGMQLSRSRPYQKNDNRNVEQKNYTLVREYFGHARLDTPEQVEVMNELYTQMWVYYNLFQPVMHLVSKEVIDGKLRREWDEAKTPYQRLKQTGVLSEEQRHRLDGLYQKTNPRVLRGRIYKRIPELWQLDAGSVDDQEAVAIGAA